MWSQLNKNNNNNHNHNCNKTSTLSNNCNKRLRNNKALYFTSGHTTVASASAVMNDGSAKWRRKFIKMPKKRKNDFGFYFSNADHHGHYHHSYHYHHSHLLQALCAHLNHTLVTCLATVASVYLLTWLLVSPSQALLSFFFLLHSSF